MCGIAGIFHPAGSLSPADIAAAAHMTQAQTHRGPDDSGTFHDAFAALGHRRLSIIDLSAAGRQPLANEDATVQVVCNGEIYNYRDLTRELEAAGHRFRSSSDCEVLVHGYEQWGMEGLLRRLRGMFAFLLYDAGHSALYAARDRLGIKPLYYAVAPDGRWVFASEVKALMQCGLADDTVDSDAIAGFLLLGSVPHPKTWHREVRCLEPGSYLEVSAKAAEDTPTRMKRYWVPGMDTGGEESPSGVLTTAVGQHLISDAPLGVFLSSGVDSTGLVALARRAGLRVRTLTVVFDEAEFNEETKEIALRYGTDHSEVRVTSDDFLRELPHVLSAMDQPTADGLNTFFVSRAAHLTGLKTALSGLGGDEIFRGYRHYRWLEKYRQELNLFGHLPGVARSALASAAASAGTLAGRERWTSLRGLAEATPEALYRTIRSFFSPEVVGRLTGRGTDAILKCMPLLYGATSGTEGRSLADPKALQLVEMNRYLHDQLLRDADVFGMAWSLEIRVPYLDHEVVEQALAVPDSKHSRPGVNKPMLVDAIGDEGVLTAARRPKSGFVFPLDIWMRRHSGELRERAMQADLDRTEIANLWAAFDQGRMSATRAWALVVMGSMNSRGRT